MPGSFDRFNSVDEVLEHALGLASVERSKFLADVRQGDPELADQVERMLADVGDATLGNVLRERQGTGQSLAPGETLGDYRIESELGAGGMGVVYAASDLRLDRRVAIKVLSPHLANNPLLRERFLREARAISQLQHPNICVLHDVGSQRGIDFLVMERLEGETLQQRLTRQAMPYDEALRVGGEVARALDHAHRQGVVHRDVKPGNIFLTQGGAKLMDFGLARRDFGMGSAQTEAPTLKDDPLTAEGVILGTLQYMAPEQIEGNPTTPQTDVFAFGTVLYEMLTGKRTFEGDSQAAFISAVLRDKATSVSELQPASSPWLDRLVATCLEKRPEDRWQSMADLARELTFLNSEPSVTAITTKKHVSTLEVTRHWSRRAGPWLMAAAFFALGAVLANWNFGRPDVSRAAPTLRQFSLHDSDIAGQAALSPDGKYVVGVTADGLQVSNLETGISRKLVAKTQSPTISPDSKWIAFYDVAEQALVKVPIEGGAKTFLARQIAPFLRSFLGAGRAHSLRTTGRPLPCSRERRGCSPPSRVSTWRTADVAQLLAWPPTTPSPRERARKSLWNGACARSGYRGGAHAD